LKSIFLASGWRTILVTEQKDCVNTRGKRKKENAQFAYLLVQVSAAATWTSADSAELATAAGDTALAGSAAIEDFKHLRRALSTSKIKLNPEAGCSILSLLSPNIISGADLMPTVSHNLGWESKHTCMN
jgi:hypothetical protein